MISIELDAQSGEVISVSGDHDSIRKTCSILLNALEARTRTDDTAVEVDRPPLPGRGRALTDLEARDRARPSSILAAIGGERELSSSPASRPNDPECERELPSTSSDATSTRTWERELTELVEPHDRTALERDSFDHRSPLDARSDDNGNVLGSGPAVDAPNHSARTPEDVTPPSGTPAPEPRDEHLPRPTGEGTPAREIRGSEPPRESPDEVGVRERKGSVEPCEPIVAAPLRIHRGGHRTSSSSQG